MSPAASSSHENVVTLERKEYNGFGKLIWVYRDTVQSAYTYRPDGLRHEKIVTTLKDASVTRHIWDGQSIVAEANEHGVFARYIRGIGLIAREQDNLLQYYLFNAHALYTETPQKENMVSTGQGAPAQQVGVESLEYFLLNAHGDVIALTNASGQIVKAYDYDAFGNQRNIDPKDTNPFRYCAEYWDSDTETYYLRNRHDDPVIGRFTSEDPIRDDLNWYTYTGNNPIAFIDPLGLAGVTISGVGFVKSSLSSSTPKKATSGVTVSGVGFVASNSSSNAAKKTTSAATKSATPAKTATPATKKVAAPATTKSATSGVTVSGVGFVSSNSSSSSSKSSSSSSSSSTQSVASKVGQFAQNVVSAAKNSVSMEVEIGAGLGGSFTRGGVGATGEIASKRTISWSAENGVENTYHTNFELSAGSKNAQVGGGYDVAISYSPPERKDEWFIGVQLPENSSLVRTNRQTSADWEVSWGGGIYFGPGWGGSVSFNISEFGKRMGW